MKRRSIAAILSALVFPGVGQYYLGRKARALLFALVALVSGWIYLRYQIDTASSIADQVLGGSVALDPAAIEAKVAAQSAPPGVTVCGYVLLGCWVASIVDIYLTPAR